MTSGRIYWFYNSVKSQLILSWNLVSVLILHVVRLFVLQRSDNCDLSDTAAKKTIIVLRNGKIAFLLPKSIFRTKYASVVLLWSSRRGIYLQMTSLFPRADEEHCLSKIHSLGIFWHFWINLPFVWMPGSNWWYDLLNWTHLYWSK